MRVALVSCVKLKQQIPAPAKDLYVSPLFRALRRHAEANADRWMILSAEYGLLSPETVIGPYERTLNHMPVRERRAWAGRVLASLTVEVSKGDTVMMLAGTRYREGIIPTLMDRGISVEIPLEDLKTGQQLQWLKRQRSGE